MSTHSASMQKKAYSEAKCVNFNFKGGTKLPLEVKPGWVIASLTSASIDSLLM